MTTDQTTIILNEVRQMFIDSEERFEKRFDKIDKRFVQIDKRFEKIEGVLQFLDTKIEHKFTLLNTRIDDLETSMNKQFESLAKEAMLYTSAGLDNHELRIVALEENKSVIS